MTEMNEIYKCDICGNIVEMVHTGIGTLVCCGEPMKLQAEKIKDEGKEKHVPVIEKTKTGFKVKVGAVPHPMEAKHYIEWIEVITDGVVRRKHLKPGMKPEAEFCAKAGSAIVREYCSVHGLWKGK